jgi:hypothetical protein
MFFPLSLNGFLGALLSLPQRFLATYGLLGIVALAGVGTLAFKEMQTTRKPLMAAIAMVLVALAAWRFWPSRSGIPQEVPTSQADIKALNDEMQRREYAKIIAKRRWRRSHRSVQRWR